VRLSIVNEDKGDKFTAYAYEDGLLVIADAADFDSAKEAIEFAKSRNWDAVVNQTTGKTIYSREAL